MSYREPTEALRAQLEQAEEQLRDTRLAATSAEQKLSRAESALAAYRAAEPQTAARTEAAAWVVMCISLLPWLASLVSVMQDHDELGSHLAAAAALVALVAPLVIHAAAGSLLVGGVSLVVRLGVALFITSSATVRRAATDNHWHVLFWVGPTALVVATVVECGLLIRSARSR